MNSSQGKNEFYEKQLDVNVNQKLGHLLVRN